MERARATNTEQINSLQTELEQFRQLLHETSRERDSLVEQRNAKQLEYEREVGYFVVFHTSIFRAHASLTPATPRS